jgi:hypothetical protein
MWEARRLGLPIALSAGGWSALGPDAKRLTLKLRVTKRSQRLLFKQRGSRRTPITLTPKSGKAIKATPTLTAAKTKARR